MLTDTFTDQELDIWRKYFNGEKLTRAEKRRLERAKQRDLKNFISEMTLVLVFILPVVALYARSVWK